MNVISPVLLLRYVKVWIFYSYITERATQFTESLLVMIFLWEKVFSEESSWIILSGMMSSSIDPAYQVRVQLVVEQQVRSGRDYSSEEYCTLLWHTVLYCTMVQHTVLYCTAWWKRGWSHVMNFRELLLTVQFVCAWHWVWRDHKELLSLICILTVKD